MRLLKLIPVSVGGRVAFAVNAIVLVLGVTFLVFDYRRESSQRLNDKVLALEGQAMTLHQAVSLVDRNSLADQQRVIDAVCGRMSDEVSPGHHIVVEIDGKTLQSQVHHRSSDDLLQTIRYDDEPDIESTALLVGKHSEGGITVRIGEQVGTAMREIRRRAALRSLGVFAFGVLLSVAINIVVHRLVQRPLRRLVKTIDAIASGDFRLASGRFEGLELTRLVDAVNSMSGSLARAERQRKIALDKARRVQANLLPRLEEGGLDVAYFHHTADEVGGDFLDIFRTKSGATVLCLADVVGHGIAPAMITAMLKVLLMEAAEAHADPAEMMKLLNHRFTAVSLPEDFATVFLGVWTPEDRRLRYVSAGHEPVFYRPDDDSDGQLLSSTGLMVGLDQDTEWESHSVQIAPGAYLAGWTDGVTDAWDETDERFGRDRLISLFEQHTEVGPIAATKKIESAVKAHARSGPLADDCTFFAVQFS